MSSVFTIHLTEVQPHAGSRGKGLYSFWAPCLAETEETYALVWGKGNLGASAW